VTTSAEGICAAIRARDSFIITSHARPDGDAVGSSMALSLALDTMGKRSRVVLKDPVPSPYAGFPKVDRIEQASRVEGPAEAAIVLECSDLSRPEVSGLDAYFIINVDHHEGNTLYGALNWFDPSAAACGELVAEVIDGLGIAWSPDIASHIYLAIATDTGGLRYGPITARTFELCRRVAATGVETPMLSRQIFDSFSLGRIRLTGALLSGMTLHHANRVAVLSLDDELLSQSGATIDDTEGLVNLPLAAREVVGVAMLKQQADQVFRVSLRSKGAVDVRIVASRWNGGGHHNAAGCTIAGSEHEVRQALVAALGDALNTRVAP
jgi:bifunctional oligoribonuclease and PAP phosphatase NrnA